MIKQFLAILCISFLFFPVYSQCEGFEAPATFNVAYSHCNDLIEGKAALFSAKEPHFYYFAKANKPGKMIALPTSKSGLAYMLSLASDKKLKLKSADILLIQEALNIWMNKKTELMVASVAKEKFTAEQLGSFEFTREPSGLGIHFLDKGDGPLPEKGKNVKVHYRGYLTNGNVFDASYDRNTAFEFPLGMGRVIKGWEEGIAKIPVGSRALLRIPPEMGYGSREAGSIPANSVLIFDVFVLGQ